MGRKPRVEYEGAIYHVIQRGNNSEYIFNNSNDKEFLVKDILSRKNDMNLRLFGYVVMSNHYHLLLQIMDMDNTLNKIMHRFNNRYSKYYNKQYGRTGHVFGERYKAIPVQDDSYLLTLLRYIHQNPVRAGICKRVEEYEWNSDSFYRDGNEKDLNIEVILDAISKDRNLAVKQYKEFMEEMDDTEYNEEKVGEEAFRLVVGKRTPVIVRKRLDEILIDTGVSDLEYKLIKEGSRKRSLKVYKAAYAKKALELNYTYKEIGQNIKLSDVAIIYLVNNLVT
jgi:putative transposase